MAERWHASDEKKSPGDSPEVRAAVRAAAVDHLYGQGGIACAMNVVVVVLVVSVLVGHAPDMLLFSWGAVLVAINGVRMLVIRARQQSPERNPDVWLWRHVPALCVSSALWGLSAPLFLPGVPASESLAIAIALAGVAAGGLPLNAAILPIYTTHVGLTLAPLFVTFVTLGGRTYMVLALMTLAFAVTLYLAGRAYSRNLRDANLFARRLDEVNCTLERRASHDPLTGLWNRQRFETALDAELERVRRYHSRCALVMLDVDHFKQVNDVHGHDAGDRVLEHLGALLTRETRAPDQPARWGGEEFMILLPESGTDAARNVAERIRRCVAESPFEGPDRVTVSLGVTASVAAEERSVLFRRLDDALYRAKQNGRNCVHVEPEPHADARGPGGAGGE